MCAVFPPNFGNRRAEISSEPRSRVNLEAAGIWKREQWNIVNAYIIGICATLSALQHNNKSRKIQVATQEDIGENKSGRRASENFDLIGRSWTDGCAR